MTAEIRTLKYLHPQLHMGKANPKEATYELENRPGLPKPKGGLWTSTYDEEHGSAWMKYCGTEGPGFMLGPKGHVCSIKREARIAVIDKLEDLLSIILAYPLKNEWSTGGRWDIVIDFEAMSKHYDGVHLTEKGQGATRLSAPVDLYGWDVESTLFFRDAFEECKPVDLAAHVERYQTMCQDIIEAAESESD